MFEFIIDCYKNEKVCDKTVNIYSHALKFVPDCYKTWQIYDKVVFKEPFMLKYFYDRYKTHEMCDKTLDACFLTLKCIPHWLVVNKLFEKLDGAVFSKLLFILDLWLCVIDISSTQDL